MTNRKIEFRNVDLVLRHRVSVRKVVRALQPSTFVTHVRDNFAVLESAGNPKTVEAAIAGLFEAIEALPKSARALWDACSVRQFDIGLLAGDRPHSVKFKVSRDSIERIQRVGGEIVITVYAPRRPEAAPPRKGRVLR
jgi:hypothetical protein